MRLVRFGDPGGEKPGVMRNDDSIIDVSIFVADFNETFFANDGLARLEKWLNENEKNCPEISSGTRLGPPIARPSKIVCIGLNYSQHAAESGLKVPPEPVLFFKASSAITGPYDDIIIPRNSEKTDWEVELAFVMTKKASYVEEQEAMDYVAGYVLHNDVSEREFQIERSGQWVKGKSADTFAPLGPFLATKDEVSDPHNLDLWLKVNDETMQSSNTSDLVFKVPFLVSYISQFMTLLPGDVVSTGTPFGVGLGLKPPRYLKHGDVVELGIEGLGTARQQVKAWQSS